VFAEKRKNFTLGNTRTFNNFQGATPVAKTLYSRGCKKVKQNRHFIARNSVSLVDMERRLAYRRRVTET
jgi:hypothetical protein